MSAQETPRAFPSSAIDDDFGGMTLRDYFAGKALEAIMLAAGIQSVLKQEQFLAEPICRDAYKFADAMLAERRK
ncbi:MAG: hypothetical protein V4530_06225 [Pseudomonadota bacterium]